MIINLTEEETSRLSTIAGLTTGGKDLIFLPANRSSLADFVAAYIADGYSYEGMQTIVAELNKSNLFRSEEPND